MPYPHHLEQAALPQAGTGVAQLGQPEEIGGAHPREPGTRDDGVNRALAHHVQRNVCSGYECRVPALRPDRERVPERAEAHFGIVDEQN